MADEIDEATRAEAEAQDACDPGDAARPSRHREAADE